MNALFDFIKNHAPLKKLKKGELLFCEGVEVEFIPYLMEGGLKVYILSDSGREILIYKVLPERFCVIAMVSALTGQKYPAYTIAEKDSKVLLIEPDRARRLLDSDAVWRKLFLNELSKGFLSILNLINDITSISVKRRLIQYLMDNISDECTVKKTHEEIAKDICSSRVVISRLLKELEANGFVSLKRGKVLIKKAKGRHVASLGELSCPD